jgi:hypothetical protein
MENRKEGKNQNGIPEEVKRQFQISTRILEENLHYQNFRNSKRDTFRLRVLDNIGFVYPGVLLEIRNKNLHVTFTQKGSYITEILPYANIQRRLTSPIALDLIYNTSIGYFPENFRPIINIANHQYPYIEVTVLISDALITMFDLTNKIEVPVEKTETTIIYNFKSEFTEEEAKRGKLFFAFSKILEKRLHPYSSSFDDKVGENEDEGEDNDKVVEENFEKFLRNFEVKKYG